MNSRDRYCLVNFIPALLVALLLAGCQTANTIPPGAAVGAPRLVVGDHWQYKITDNLRRGAVTMLDVEVASIAGAVATLRETFDGPYGRSEENEEVDANGWLVVGSLKNETLRRFPVPVKLYDFPLEQGKTWRQVIPTISPETQLPAQILVYGTVQGTRPVTVAAGSFEPVYVYRILQLDDDQFFRSRTERRDSVWYGADVKAPVRELHDASYTLYDGQESAPVRTENTTRDLISFRPGKG
ncbi:MAG: hypothetical protein ABI981_05830 [Betaproteobacteria bacterium]